jgi:hypothetical protein
MNKLTNSSRNAELISLARGISRREQTLLGLEEKTMADCAEWLREAILQGADLNAARARLKHGEWLDWLKVNCSTVHYLKANRYMHLAANLSRVKDLTGAESLRQALALCGVPVEGAPKEIGQGSLPYIEGISKCNKFVSFLGRHELSSWPPEGRAQLKEDLEPIAKQLWPERFC